MRHGAGAVGVLVDVRAGRGSGVRGGVRPVGHHGVVRGGAVRGRERPVEQGPDPGVPADRGQDHLDARVDAFDVGAERRLVELHGLGDVGLGDDDQVRETEGGGVLEGLVLALRDGGEDDAEGLPQVVGGRTDEVADVLDEQQPGAVGQPALHVTAEHPGLQVAQPVGEDLLDRDARAREPSRVVLGGEVGGERRDRHGPPPGQLQFTFQQGRLAAAGAGEQIDDGGAAGGQFRAQGARALVVLGEYGLLQVDHTAHGSALLGDRFAEVRVRGAVLPLHAENLQFAARRQVGTGSAAARAGQQGRHADGPFVGAGRAAGPSGHRLGDQFGAFEQGAGAGQFEAEGEESGTTPASSPTWSRTERTAVTSPARSAASSTWPITASAMDISCIGLRPGRGRSAPVAAGRPPVQGP